MKRENGPKLTAKEIGAIRASRGAAARIARSVGVNESLVSRVLSGERTGRYQKKTARVLEALRAEARRLMSGGTHD